MPMTLNVGLTKKVGLPDYGSLGASCHVEVELDGSLIRDDLEKFHTHVRNAFIACRQAVQDELSRHQAGSGPPPNGAPTTNGQTGNGHSNGHGRRPSNGQNGTRRSTSRRATASQVRAINAIASQSSLDLAGELRERFHVDRPEDLSISDASQFIDALKAAPAANGDRR